MKQDDMIIKITNITGKANLLTYDQNGWDPAHGFGYVNKFLTRTRRYWWSPKEAGQTPVILGLTLDQAVELIEHGYKFEIMGDSLVKITNIKQGKSTLVEKVTGWKPDTSNAGAVRVWEVEKYLDPNKKYWVTSAPYHGKPAVAELKLEDVIALKSEGYTFDIVKEDEEMNETEGPKFYALQGKYGLVFDLPGGFQHGFEAGKVTTGDIEDGGGYLIFTNLEQAQKIADYSYPAGGLDKLQVVEVDPIAKKVIKEVKQTKWRIAWSGGETTPKWFKGNAFSGWSLVTSKSEAREFDTLENAECVVKIFGLAGLYIVEDK